MVKDKHIFDCFYYHFFDGRSLKLEELTNKTAITDDSADPIFEPVACDSVECSIDFLFNTEIIFYCFNSIVDNL